MTDAIYTIEDYKNATEENIEELVDTLPILDEVKRYIAWLNSPDGERITVTAELGEGDKKHRLGLYPYALAKKGTCPLAHYFGATGEVPPVKRVGMKLQLIFDTGTMLHAMLQAMLKDMYEDQFESEHKLQHDRLLIMGRADGRFDWPKLRALVEIKSIREGGSSGYERAEVRPLKDHVRQLIVNMGAADIPFGLVIYICKNNGLMCEHVVRWDQQIWDEIEGECRPIADAVANKEPPAPKTGGSCRSCQYVDGCKFGKDHLSGKTRSRRRSATLRGNTVRR